MIFFFTYFWPQGVSVILKVITAREKYFVCNVSTVRPSTCIFCFRFIGRLLNLIYPLIIIEDNKTNLVTKFNLFCLAISNSYQILLCLLLLLMTKIINDQNIWYTLMDLICKKQIKDNQPHILVPSLQKLGQSIPSCTHTVIYNKMYV